jgi:hypothetical protein
VEILSVLSENLPEIDPSALSHAVTIGDLLSMGSFVEGPTAPPTTPYPGEGFLERPETFPPHPKIKQSIECGISSSLKFLHSY